MRPTDFREIEALMDQMLRQFDSIGFRHPRISNSCTTPDCAPNTAGINTNRFRNPINPRFAQRVDQKAEKPVADKFENPKEVICTIELPGIERDDIKVNALDEGLEVKVDTDKKKFYRYFKLGKTADKENISATHKNGVLELKIPKKEQKRTPIKVM